MTILAVGDIHGSLRALETLATRAPFDSAEIVITLGDYVDRGPDSRGVLDWLIAFSQSRPLFALLGNHELMMLRARDNALARGRWLSNGGSDTLASYASGGGPAKIESVPEPHWEFIEKCRPFHETEQHAFTHAGGLSPEVPLEEQPEEALFWSTFGEGEPHGLDKHLVCGHTRQLEGLPTRLPHATCIDTAIDRGGWLTALDVVSNRFWQANEAGDWRTGVFQDLA